MKGFSPLLSHWHGQVKQLFTILHGHQKKVLSLFVLGAMRAESIVLSRVANAQHPRLTVRLATDRTEFASVQQGMPHASATQSLERQIHRISLRDPIKSDRHASRLQSDLLLVHRESLPVDQRFGSHNLIRRRQGVSGACHAECTPQRLHRDVEGARRQHRQLLRECQYIQQMPVGRIDDAIPIQLEDLATLLIQAHQGIDFPDFAQGGLNRLLCGVWIVVQYLDRHRGAESQGRN